MTSPYGASGFLANKDILENLTEEELLTFATTPPPLQFSDDPFIRELFASNDERLGNGYHESTAAKDYIIQFNVPGSNGGFVTFRRCFKGPALQGDG